MNSKQKLPVACPFCGTEAVTITTEHYDNSDIVLAPRFYIQCLQFLARGGYGDAPVEAVEMWNLRTKVDPYDPRR